MRYINIIIYLLLFTYSKSQNLVPNPSFETYSTCPTTSGQLNYANNWYNPTTWGSPDYFNGCSSTFGIPSYCYCSSAFQYPKTGNAYCGLWCYSKDFSNSREYMQVQITNTLTSGKCYYVSFYLNLINWSGQACNKVGCYISPTAVNATGSNSLLNFNSQIKNFNNVIVSDTLNWVQISGIYTALGGENFLTIGNFNNDNTTDSITVNTSTPYGAYYLIDDVSIVPIDSIINGMPANAGLDKSIAIGDSVFIGQTISNLNCNWSILGGSQIATNTSGIYVQPLSPTTYVVEQDLCGTITYDTVYVFVSPTGLKEYNAFSNSINIFPNPTTNNFTISNLTESSKLKVDITDTQGKLYSTELITISNNKTTIKTNLPNGVYFVSITDTVSGLKTIKKLMVQK
jgi:hypothetical protein